MTPPPLKLTEPRRRAIATLLAGPARISNNTGPGRVYWQVADWLRSHGYAELDRVNTLKLTLSGSDLAASEDITTDDAQ